jgi:hypothetical protein
LLAEASARSSEPFNEDHVMAQPTFWQVGGGGFGVVYNIAAAQLIFMPPSAPPLVFNGHQIRTVRDPDIGTVVSVTLHAQPNAHHVTFSLVLPQVNLAAPPAPVPVWCLALMVQHLVPAPAVGQDEFDQPFVFQGFAT